MPTLGLVEINYYVAEQLLRDKKDFAGFHKKKLYLKIVCTL